MNQPSDHAKTIFLRALENHPPEQWEDFLDGACGGDSDLRARVADLLQAHNELGSFRDDAPARANTVDMPAAPEAPGAVIGPYKLLQQIGEGGMGVVYMAEQTAPVKRKVALKVIKPGMDTRQVIVRFEAERQALALMDHPNIARVFDAGATEAGRPYFVMELVKGVPITEYCDLNNLPMHARLELFVTVCHAVQHAHQKGIIHRDIKPSNVMVTLHDGQPVVKVIDFGIAKAVSQQLTEKTLFTNFAQMVGTPLYMSPEQAELTGLDVDTRTDIYALGVLLYELLTGTTPFEQVRMRQAALDEIRRIIREEEPPRPSTRLSSTEGGTQTAVAARRHIDPRGLSRLVRGDLDWIAMKALEKDRTRRYATANAFAADVVRYLSDEPVEACPPTSGYRFRKFARRNRVAMMTTGLVTLALVAGTIVSTWQAIRATRARQDAEVSRTEEAAQRAVADQRRIEADEQRTEAESQRQQADDARKDAIASLQKAREAGEEFFTLVSESRLLEEPGLQPLRKDLLEAAVTYYEGLATGKSEDPRAQTDVIASRLRLVQIYYHTGAREQHILALEKGVEVVAEFLAAHPNAASEHCRLAGFFYGGRGGYEMQPFSDRHRAEQAYEQATTLWEELVKRYPAVTGFQSDLSKFYDLQANVQLEMGRREDALRTAQKVRTIREQIVRANPGVYEHVAELAHSYKTLAVLLSETDPDAAEAWFRQAVTIQKDAPDIATYQEFLGRHELEFGQFLRTRGRPEEAIPLLHESAGIFEKLAEKFPHDSQFRAMAEKSAEAVEIINQIAPRTGAEYLARAKHYQSLGDTTRALADYQNAVAVASALVASSQSDAALRADLLQLFTDAAWSLIDQAKLPEEGETIALQGLAVAEQAIADFPNEPKFHWKSADLYFALGWSRIRAKRDAPAAEAFRQEIKRRDDLDARFGSQPPRRLSYERAWNGLGIALGQAGKLEEAIAAHQRALELADKLAADIPTNAEYVRRPVVSHSNLAGLFRQASQLDKAEEHYRHVADFFATHPEQKDSDNRRAWALSSLALLLSRRGEHEKAAEIYGQLLTIQPDSPSPCNDLAWLLATCPEVNLRDPTRAIELARKAIELAPNNCSHWNTLGVAQYRVADWTTAIQSLTRSEELAPDQFTSFNEFFLAMAHSQLGETDAARRCYDRAVAWMEQHQPADPELQRFRAEAVELLAPSAPQDE